MNVAKSEKSSGLLDMFDPLHVHRFLFSALSYKDTLQKVRLENRDLNEQVKRLRRELEEKDEALQSTRQDIEYMQTSCYCYNPDMTTSLRTDDHTGDHTGDHTDDHADNHTQLHSHSQDSEALLKCREGSRQFMEYQKKCVILEGQLEEAEDRNLQMEDSLEYYKVKCDKYMEELNEHHAAGGQLRDRLEEARNMLIQKDKHIEYLMSDLEMASQRQQIFTEQLQKFVDLYESKSAQLSSTEADLSKSTVKLALCESDLENCRSQLQTAQQERKKSDELLDKYQNDLITYREHHSHTNQEFATMEKMLQWLEFEKEDLYEQVRCKDRSLAELKKNDSRSSRMSLSDHWLTIGSSESVSDFDDVIHGHG